MTVNLKLDGWLFVPKCCEFMYSKKNEKEKKKMPLNNVLHIVFGNSLCSYCIVDSKVCSQ